MSTEGLTRQQTAAVNKRERINTRILDAARTLFDQHGYHGATRRDVCRAVGISLAALNGYFPTKEGLVIAAYAPYVQTAIYTAEIPGEAPNVKVREFVTELSAVLYDHPAMAVALSLSHDPRTVERGEELAVTIQQLAEFLGTLLARSGVNSEVKLELPNTHVAEFSLFGLVKWAVQYPDDVHFVAADLALSSLFATL
ncbi:MAG TPA: helix-turn-helix domain-containing protein [Candidatus Saccharimonadales bacterium]|nr:helix-turn-helix domain-containing protein [Candidatus Saccharimonadales bacterium]